MMVTLGVIATHSPLALAARAVAVMVAMAMAGRARQQTHLIRNAARPRAR